MTGRELMKWIEDSGAENLDVYFLQEDGILVPIHTPEVMENEDLIEEYWEANPLDPDGRCVVL